MISFVLCVVSLKINLLQMKTYLFTSESFLIQRSCNCKSGPKCIFGLNFHDSNSYLYGQFEGEILHYAKVINILARMKIKSQFLRFEWNIFFFLFFFWLVIKFKVDLILINNWQIFGCNYRFYWKISCEYLLWGKKKINIVANTLVSYLYSKINQWNTIILIDPERSTRQFIETFKKKKKR